MSFAEMLTRGGLISLGLGEKMLADIKPETFARKIRIDGAVVNANHPAFVYGHLSTYPAAWLTSAGLDPAPAAIPPGYAELFGAGRECRDDEHGSIYPPMAEIVATFTRVHKAPLAPLAALTDDQLRAPNPREGRLREMFPTLGGLLMFYMTSHVMMHLGQVSTWRRCMGLGSVM